MADFRMRDDAANWFGHIAGRAPLKVKFDMYYYCLMLGLAARRKSNPSKNGRKAPGFVGSMPDPYNNIQELIVGILVRAEIDRFGVKLNDRNGVREILSELVGRSGLSADGVSQLNEYSSGGFDVVFESGLGKPYTLSEFFVGYQDLLASASS